MSLSGYIDSLAEYAALNNVPTPANFPIDVTLISGRFGLYNPVSDSSGSDELAGTRVPVGDTTRRQSLPEPESDQNNNDSNYQTPEPKDYNNDDLDDYVSELGALTDAYIDEDDEQERKKLFGVWFSKPDDATEGEGGVLIDADGEPILPDLVRVADLVPNFDNIGLLEQISEQDLLETDLYVFRESTGELVVEKLNFARDGERTETPQNGVDEQSSAGYFELTIPGQDASNSFRSVYRDRSLYKDYEDWQASLGIQESLQGYQADSLRVGEPLTLVVINRATGYLGTASTSVLDVTEQSINIELPDIKLFPPNLQVQVDRQYQVDKGLTAGQTRNYRVGSEGAALTSDQYVRIHTQWMNHDGTALPSELPGFTGRLANLIGDADLNPSKANHFSIAPGKHTEVIKLPNAALSTTAAHQYLHVVGRELNAMPDAPDFGADPSSEFPERPGQFVPIKVAVYDEAASETLQKTQQALELEGVKQDSSVYRWVYRPEMQYSVFQLDVNQVQAVDEQGVEHELPTLTSTIPGDAEQLALDAYLSSGPYGRLPSIDVFGDLIVDQGANQQLLEPAVQAQRIEITDFQNLDANDYLSIQLINSEDASNVLSEWVYQTLTMFPGPNVDPIELSADDTQDRLYTAVLSGLSPKGASGVDWIVSGESDISNRRSVSDDPLFITSVNISPVAGTEFSLAVKTLDELSAPTSSINYTVIPGEASDIRVSQTGKTAIEQIGEVLLDIRVLDRFGNNVADGTRVGIDAPGLIVNSDTLTQDGRLQATLVGATEAGTFPVTVYSGVDSETLDVVVHDVKLAIEGDTEHLTGSTAQFQIRANTSYGSLDGVRVDVSAIRGALPIRSVVLQDGVASVSMPVGNIPGKGWLFAKFSNAISRLEFDVVDDGNSYVTNRVLVNDVSGPGVLSLQGEQVEYSNATDLVIRGAPGVSVTAIIGDFMDPPMEPLLSYPMQQAPISAQVQDEQRNVPATTQSVSVVNSPFLQYSRAFRFTPSSALEIADAQYQNTAQPGVVFNVRPAGDDEEEAEGSQTLLSMPSHGLALTREGEVLVATVAQGEQSVSVRSQSLPIEQWQRVAVHLVDDELVLQVDEQISRADLITPILAAAIETNLGGGFEGDISAVEVFDWEAPLQMSFDGERSIEVILDDGGQATLGIQARTVSSSGNPANPSSTVQAADTDCVVAPVDDPEAGYAGQAIDQAEAFARNMADCVAASQIQEQIIILKSDAGFIRKSVAITNLAAYSKVWLASKVSEIALSIGPDCAQGIVLGNPDNLVSTVCDFATALLLVGDVRDFVYHSWWLYWDTKDENGEYRYDKAVHVFATLGIATTAATATGVLAGLDVLMAGCKVAAKVMKGSELPLALANHIENKLDGDLTDINRIATVSQGVLAVMQVTAVAVLLRDDFRAAYQLLSEIDGEKIDGWISYLEEAVPRANPFTVAQVDLIELPEWLRTAYAALTKQAILRLLSSDQKLEGLLKALDDTFKFLDEAKVGGSNINRQAYLREVLSDSIASLGQAMKSSDELGRAQVRDSVRELIADDRMLSALAVLYDVSKVKGEELFGAIYQFPCTNRTCDMGGFSRTTNGDAREAYRQYFGLFVKYAELLDEGKLTPDAYNDLEKVFKQMRNPNKNIARGAAEVFAGILKVADELDGKDFRIDRIELNGKELRTDILNGNNERIAGREYDFTVLVDGKLIKYEMKSWDPEAIEYYLSSSLKGKRAKGNDEIVGQFRNDFITVLNDAMDASGNVDLDKILIRWRFDGRSEAAGIDTSYISGIIRNVLKDSTEAELFRNTSKHIGFTGEDGVSNYEKFLKDHLDSVVERMFEIRGTP